VEMVNSIREGVRSFSSIAKERSTIINTNRMIPLFTVRVSFNLAVQEVFKSVQEVFTKALIERKGLGEGGGPSFFCLI